MEIEAAIDASSLITLNENTPTRLPPAGAYSSSDVSIISSHLALRTVWTTHTTLNSDHLPIVITITNPSLNPTGKRRTFTNFRKADWDSSYAETEASFAALPLPNSCSASECIFCSTLASASKHEIAAGHF